MKKIPKIYNGFVFNVESDLISNYRLNSFNTTDVGFNKLLPHSTTIDEYFSKRFQNRNFIYTANGRHGISLALDLLCLNADDYITIFTTTGNKYISGCVTKEIEKYCKWSRNIEKNTKALFVNHEFGFVYPYMKSLYEYNLPIIEDYCYSFFSGGFNEDAICNADFTLYSFAKFFPIQIGGLLTANSRYTLPKKVIDPSTEQYIKNVLSHYQSSIEYIASKRQKNYNELSDILKPFGFSPRFILAENDVPGVFIFNAPLKLDLQYMKEYLWERGIHCSVFYGEQSFFIPVHHRLTRSDFEYFSESIKLFLDIN